MFCKYCGKNLPDDAVFCGGCGKQLVNTPVKDTSDDDTIVIDIYNEETEDTTVVLPHFARPQAPQPPVEKPYTPVQEEIPYTPVQRPEPPYTPVQRPEPATEKTNKALSIAIIATAAVFVTCLMVLVVFLLIPKSDSQPSGGHTNSGVHGGNTVQATEPTEATEPVQTQPVNPLSESNPYRPYFQKNTPYRMADSNSRYYVRSELTGLSATELSLARNEILARHGYIFQDADLLEYFTNKSWYTQKTSSFDSVYAQLNDHEKANIELFRFCQDLKEGKTATPGGENIYLEYYDPESEYIVPQSDRTELSVQDLKGLDKDALCLARNEILARHGYTFTTDVMVYFSYCSWYTPSGQASNDQIKTSDIETKNIDFIRKVEDTLLDLEDLDVRYNYTVSCDAFQVKLPNYWKTCADVTTGTDSIRFYEAMSHWDNAGHVFSLFVIRPEEYNTFWGGMNQKIGTLVSPQGEIFYLVRVEPTDVQYDYTNDYIMTIYRNMSDETYAIEKSITGINGWDYIPG